MVRDRYSWSSSFLEHKIPWEQSHAGSNPALGLFVCNDLRETAGLARPEVFPRFYLVWSGWVMTPILVPAPEWYFTLDMDALFMTAARSHLRYVDLPKSVAQMQRRLESMQSRIDELDSWNDSDEIEPLAIQADGLHSTLLMAYRPSLQRCAQVNVLAALSVEAHVNRRVYKAFPKSEAEKVVWVPMEERINKVLRANGATPLPKTGKHLSNLRGLMRRRHALVHYRPRKLGWELNNVPKVPTKLGLSGDVARRSVVIAGEVIGEIHDRLDEQHPYWLKRSAVTFFGMEFD